MNDKGLNNVYAIDLASTNTAVVALAEGFEAAFYFVGADRGQLYFQTTLAAPRGRVVAMDPAHAGRAFWKEIIPQGPDAMDVAGGSVTLVNHELIVRTLRDVGNKVTIYGLDDRYRGVHGGRRVIFMNREDMAEAGLEERQLVDLTSHFENERRTIRDFSVIGYDIPRRCTATY